MSDSTSPLLRGKKIGILGTGNMGQTLIKALVESGVVESRQIFAANRSYKKLAKVVEKWGVNEVKDPEELTMLFLVIGFGLIGGANKPILSIVSFIFILPILFFNF